MRRGTRQLGASPVLIGAVTVMIAIVAVFISYQANNGLPFVPTYQLEAQVPNGAKLVKGNEVRAGGFRVGIVKDIKSARIAGTAPSASSRSSTSSWTRASNRWRWTRRCRCGRAPRSA